MHDPSPSEPRRRRRRPQAVIAAVVSTMIGAAVVIPSLATTPASAAGAGIVNVQIDPIDLTTGNPLTEIGLGAPNAQVTYKVQYSCGNAPCDATQVAFAASQPAPANPVQTVPNEAVLRYSSFVQPAAGGATMSGNDTVGRTFTLGDLAPGTSGTFSVTYVYQQSRAREIPPAAWLPDGAPVPMTATISSSTATGPASSNANVTWQRATADPAVGMFNSGTVKPGTPVALKFVMDPGNMTTSNGIPVARASTPAASYSVVAHLPAEATISSADLGGVIDNAAHTVTWTEGTPASPSYGARFGWGDLGGDGSHGANDALVPDGDTTFGPRTVDVTFPASAFPAADADGCNFSAVVTSTIDATVSYVDGAVKSATTQSGNTTVACQTPFGGMATPTKAIVGASTSAFGDGIVDNQGPGAADDVFAVNVPAPGTTDTANRVWRVAATNQGNVTGTAVIDEPNLVQPGLQVDRISVSSYTGADQATFVATVEWVDNTGATGTAPLGVGQSVDAAAGRWFTSARTTAPIAPSRVLLTDTGTTSMSMDYRFHVASSATIGDRHTNTADVSISYPADADGDGTPDAYTDTSGAPLPSRAASASVSRAFELTQPTPILASLFNGAPTVDGGANLLPGVPVTFKVRAQTSSVYPGTRIQPQLVLVAPLGWHVLPGSASITAPGTGWGDPGPSGVTFTYGTKLVSGVPRDVAVATWPDLVDLDPTATELWPTMSVKATPTNLAPTGVDSIAGVWAGDQSGTWTDVSGVAFQTSVHQVRPGTNRAAFSDTSDVDEDGTNPEAYVIFNGTTGLIVSASDSVAAVKELCVPDASAGDGCQWVSDPATPGQVLENAGTVKYRLRVTNSGNTTLHHVVAYDVLPHPGDTGLLAGAAARGSQFSLTLADIDSQSAGVTLAGSASTNPARPEVNPTASGTVDDWTTVAPGQKALRITVDGDLAPAQVREVVFQAAIANDAVAGQLACNSAAVDSNETLPAEPAAVCVQLTALPNPPPTAAITAPADGATYENGTSVHADFTCTDTDIASCTAVDEHGDAVAQGAAVDTTTPGTHSLTVVAIDSIGQTATATSTYTVKVKPNVPPTASIATPPNGAVYFQGQTVPAAYTCADSDGTVASCVGTVPVGADIDTATLGTRSFSVTATDDAGATGSAATTYTVVATKGLCKGTPISLIGIALAVSNAPTTPCTTATNKLVNTTVFVITPGIPLLGIAPNSVTIGVLNSATQSGPGSAAAQAQVAGVKIVLLGQTIEATGLTSSARSQLSSCASPAATTGLSSILTLTINGRSVANLGQSITVPLIVGALALNEHAVVGHTVSQTALHLNVLGLVDLALGQSVAGATC
jgi:hypothetical protein